MSAASGHSTTGGDEASVASHKPYEEWRLPRAVWWFPGFKEHEPAVALADNFGNGLVGFRPRRSLGYFRMSIKVWWKP